MRKEGIYVGYYESKKTGKKYAQVLVWDIKGERFDTFNGIALVEVEEKPKFKLLEACTLQVVDIRYNKPVYGFVL